MPIICAARGNRLVDPLQFELLRPAGELVENLSPTNSRVSFSRWLENALINLRFHRLHTRRINPARPRLHSFNDGQALSAGASYLAPRIRANRCTPPASVIPSSMRTAVAV